MGITNWSISHRVTIFVLMFVLAVTGMLSYTSLPRESEPDITIPFVMIATPYIGVAPADIETLITNPIEEELEQLRDVEEIRSTSAEGASIISIEFTPNAEIDVALQNVREKVDLVRPTLPADAEDPVVSEISFSDFPIMTIALSGEIGAVQLSRVAEQLEHDIKNIEGILDVRTVGTVEREVRIEADPWLLEYYNVTLSDVTAAIQAENLNVPGGSVDVGEMTWLVRIPGEFEAVRDIEGVVVKEEFGDAVYVRDVATVVDGFEEMSTYSRFNGVNCVTVVVTRRTGENIIRITDEINALLGDYDEQYADIVSFSVMDDVSGVIRSQLEELENNILTGLLLVLIVLLFFFSGWRVALLTLGAGGAFVALGLLAGGAAGIPINPWILITIVMVVGFLFDKRGGMRTAMFVATAIPFSMLISFAVLAALGITLNIVVLFSLVLALGMLVDNAIVVVENIYRHASNGTDYETAAREAVAEVAWPVIASTATTVFAFLPMAFWPGIMGEFMRYMPITLIIVLSASLFVALVINPVLCARFMRIAEEDIDLDSDPDDEAASLPDNLLYRAYSKTLRWSVSTLPANAAVIGLAFAALVGSGMLFMSAGTGTEFFPQMTPERFKINVNLPDGAGVDASNAAVRRVEQFLLEQPIVDRIVAAVGSGNDATAGGGGTQSHRSRVSVEFVDANEMDETVNEFFARLREHLDTIPAVEFEVLIEAGGPPQGDPVVIEIVGDDQTILEELSARVYGIMEGVEGVADLVSDIEVGRTEVNVNVDRESAALLGIDTFTVADTVRSAINGNIASVFREADDEHDIVVQLAEEHRSRVEDVGRLRVATQNGDRIPLSEIADVSVQQGYGSIRHIDGERVISVSSDVVEGANANVVLAAAQAAIEAEVEPPPGFELKFTGQNEEQEEAQAFLSKAFLAALFLIGLVLITQFNSVIQPAIILASVILSLIGVLLILYARQLPFSVIMTGVGVISLAGVVVNNAIVLVDYINQLRDRGIELVEAVVTAGMVRLRPVLLTAITTILSLIPTVIGISLDAKRFQIVPGGMSVEMWGPMANAVVGGLAVATLLTLVVVPSLYVALQKISDLFKSLIGTSPKPTAAVTQTRTQPSAALRTSPLGTPALSARELQTNPGQPGEGVGA